jgi:hypothetical protein
MSKINQHTEFPSQVTRPAETGRLGYDVCKPEIEGQDQENQKERGHTQREKHKKSKQEMRMKKGGKKGELKSMIFQGFQSSREIKIYPNEFLTVHQLRNIAA